MIFVLASIFFAKQFILNERKKKTEKMFNHFHDTENLSSDSE